MTNTHRRLTTVTLLLLFLRFACAIAGSQTLVPCTTEYEPGAVRVVFGTTAGKSYRVEHSNDCQAWAFFPETIYGLGQTVPYHVYDAPIPQPGTPSPPDPYAPRPAEAYLFMVSAFNDGTAVASWVGADGSPQKAYISSFDLRYLGQVMEGTPSGTRVPTAPSQPYWLSMWAWGSPKDPAVVNMQASPGEAATLAKLTSQYQWLYNEMKTRVDWLATHPGPPPTPPRLFDDRGQPLKQFFRVREFTTDSNNDGTADNLQLGTGGNAFNMDIDSDGIPNGYDSTLFPNDLRLRNVMVNEVLFANEFTDLDEQLTTQDWIELYNPTNATIDVGGWLVSDSNSNLTKWMVPAGTTIASGQFRRVWASGKSGQAGLTALHTNFSLSALKPAAAKEAMSS